MRRRSMWRDLAWVLDMLHATEKAMEYAKGLPEGRFFESSLHQDAIIRQLMIIGEAAKKGLFGNATGTSGSPLEEDRRVSRCSHP